MVGFFYGIPKTVEMLYLNGCSKEKVYCLQWCSVKCLVQYACSSGCHAQVQFSQTNTAAKRAEKSKRYTR